MNALIFSSLVALVGQHQPTALDVLQGPGAFAPRLTTSKAGALLSWLEPIRSSDGKVTAHRLRFSEYRRGRFGPSRIIWERPNIFANWADVPSVTRGPHGYLAHWAEKSGSATYAYDVRLASSNDGEHWTLLGAAHDDRTQTEHGFVSVIADSTSGFRAFWLDGRAMAKKDATGKSGPMQLRTASIRGAEIASDVLDERVCECCGTTAVQTEEGAVVFYRDRRKGEIRDIGVIRRKARSWTKPALVHRDGWKMPGCPVNGPAAAARGKDVVIAWYTGAEGGRVRIAFSRDASGTFAEPIEVHEGAAAPLGRVGAALLDHDDAVVSWLVADDEASARIVARKVGRGGQLGPVVQIAETVPSRASGFPQMVMQDEALLFAWTEVSGKRTSVRAARFPASTFDASAANVAAGAPSATASGGNLHAYVAINREGRAIGPADIKGPVLINLWATWCRPCREEIPILTRLHRTYQRDGLKVVGLTVDGTAGFDAVEALIEELKIPYLIWRDPQDRASRMFAVDALPATFLLDKSGAIVWQRKGVLQPSEPGLEREIRRLLQDEAPTNEILLRGQSDGP